MPAMTLLSEPEPLSSRTLTPKMETFLATPYVLEPMVPEQWVPWPLPSRAVLAKVLICLARPSNSYISLPLATGIHFGHKHARAYGVSVLNTGVNDIGAGTLSGARVVGIRGTTTLAVGDASKSPSCALLLGNSVDADDGILLNRLDLFPKTG